ncbi:MAG: pilus assembly protein PilM [Phycisphaerales bacterium]|nr:pilus assembly protein PilM [Phycisphaerales bacterium]
MRNTATSRSPRPIGVDIGSRCVKLAQLRRSRHGSSVVAACVPLPDGDPGREAIIAAIQSALRAGGFSGRRAVAAAPHELIDYRNMRMPRLTGAALVAAVHENLASHLDVLPDAYTSQIFDAGDVWEDDEPRREVVAMAVSHDGLFPFLDAIEAAGLVPAAVDTAPGAGLRGMHAADESDDESPTARFLLDVGYSATTMAIVCGTSVRFVRKLALGLVTLDDDTAGALSVSRSQAALVRDTLAGRTNEEWPLVGTEHEAAVLSVRAAAGRLAKQMASEIQKSGQYYAVTFRTGRPVEGTVVGGGSTERWLVDSLKKETGVAFAAIESSPWTMHPSTPAASTAPGVLAAAVGLARYGERVTRRVA